MKSYFDSSALVALYVTEQFSTAARRCAAAAGQLPFTGLHRLEVGNALALMVGRRMIAESARRVLWLQVEADIEQRRLLPLALSWEQIMDSAAGLSDRHTARLLTRSLDILHVAAAAQLNCSVFVSSDERQLQLAQVARMKITDLRAP